MFFEFKEREILFGAGVADAGEGGFHEAIIAQIDEKAKIAYIIYIVVVP